MIKTLKFAAALPRRRPAASSAVWVLAQQALVRGMVAVKFLVVGRLLGPEALGVAGVALLAVAIAEALSDTGLPQALIQGQRAPAPAELGAVWSALACRGALVALLLLGLAPLLEAQFHLAGALPLLQLAAALPLLRGVASPAYYVVTRERNFRRVAVLESVVAVADCAISVGCALGGAGAYSVVIGLLVAETLKSALTWATMRPRPPLQLRWTGIGHFLGFSRWIWAASVVNLLLNQFDKVMVGKLLGPAQLGAYQMSSKLAQMLLADAGIAMSQYLFPTFAARHRQQDGAAARLLRRLLGLGALALVLAVAALNLAAAPLFLLLLGPGWLEAVPLFRVFTLNMAIGALIALLVAYLRAIGEPRVATHASVLQVGVLLVCVPPATHWWGATGIAWSMTVGLASAMAWMLANALRSK
ncbi:oligosaccharide flippase family protein (plasmid) [Cupriavidus necator]|uniref:PST family polysaccharide export protein n=1 Tax=Cupriavidus necator TaxID=106590 RepID=A0A367P8M4_CUPNE|nr:oligosaccharide flippase family protein [Cupriavidus necator]QQX89575.1 oligosaccharide flippase family protein [Cupriavidus necator]RCJ03853.1 PST family polysaccharide export protein [Cupriavidus necator]